MAKTTIDQRAAVLEGAITVFATYGVEAPISKVAKAAGVSHGSVFHHFQSKSNLLNAAYLHLEKELDRFVFNDLATVSPHDQLHMMWSRYIDWNVKNTERRQALARLSNAIEITPETHSRALAMKRPGVELLRRAASAGLLREQGDDFLFGIVQALSGATVHAILANPTRGTELSDIGYDVLSRAIS